MRQKWVWSIIAVFISIVTAQVHAVPIASVAKQADGLLVHLNPGTLQLQVMSDAVIRVTYSSGDSIPALTSYSVIAKPAADAKWQMRESADSILLQTSQCEAHVDRKTGAVGFFDLAGKAILQETNDGRDISPATQKGVEGTQVSLTFNLATDEGIYGLGQHQQGYFDYRGHNVRLLQENREVGIPVLLSSKGYCVLWDNPAVTEVAVGTDKSGGENLLKWSSETGKAIDYYFCYGPSADEAIAHYRTITGAAPLMPKWMLGFWQCKERYRSQDELLAIAKQYRDLNIPIDGIIQDWRYWPDGAWGSHSFDKARYPDPAAMMKQLHEMHYHTLISIWPKFDLGSPNFNELEKAGALYEPVIPYVFPKGQGKKWYDPFSDKGRELYWKQISGELFSQGFDGWWMDASEPELAGQWGEFRNFKTAAGPGAEVFNAYPLMHSTGVYQGQRAQTDEQRVVILTRSAYAGQQRNSAITWSGDIGSSWNVFRNQIPAGLNFSMSGIPYWNTDIGGFFYNPKDPKRPYSEIFTRWFQFGSFCPMFRVHGSAPNGGTGPGKEYWQWDEPTKKIWKTYVDLRYRLMPYTYSVAWNVTNNGGSFMRPLVMDFPQDPQTLDIGDQYLFGPAIMVNPVTTQSATVRSVYLPGKIPWYDFWTGKTQSAGQTVDSPAPMETMPLFIRAGSIIPMGPYLQYAMEKPADPIELRVYRGADGAFTLYEDEGDSDRYEKGVRATIPITWNDAKQTLTIGDRTGEFPGMLKERIFNVVFVSENHGNGVGVSDKVDQTIKYSGTATSVSPGKY